VRKRTDVILAALICVFGCYSVSGQSHIQNLSTAAKEFFTLWLVDKKIDSATKYLAREPLLGKCITPTRFEKKEYLTRKQIRTVFRELMEITIKKQSAGGDLADFVTSKGTYLISNTDGTRVVHSANYYFTIYTLKPLDPMKNGYVCKFDERSAFLNVISQPGLYYVFTRFKFSKPYPEYVLTTVWKKEGTNWRILTFSAISDDD